MSNSQQTITTHHQDQVYYSIAQAEFEQVKEKAKISERENCLFLIGLLLPSLINCLPLDFTNQQAVPLATVINLLVVVVAFILLVLQAKGWYSKRGVYSAFIRSIENRPKVEMLISGDAENYVQDTNPPA